MTIEQPEPSGRMHAARGEDENRDGREDVEPGGQSHASRPNSGAEETAEQSTDAERTQPAARDERAEPGDERSRILRMVADGKITVEEAVELLKAVEPATPQAPPGVAAAYGPWAAGFRGPMGPVGPGRPFDVRVRMRRGGPAPFVTPLPPTSPVAPPPPMPPGPPGVDTVTWTAPAPPPFPQFAGRTLHFDVRDGEKRVTASLPLSLAGSKERFLPRLVRQGLEECEVDLDQLLDLIANGQDQLDDCTLLDMRDGDDKRVVITVT